MYIFLFYYLFYYIIYLFILFIGEMVQRFNLDNKQILD